jgi:hypothetical protein
MGRTQSAGRLLSRRRKWMAYSRHQTVTRSRGVGIALSCSTSTTVVLVLTKSLVRKSATSISGDLPVVYRCSSGEREANCVVVRSWAKTATVVQPLIESGGPTDPVFLNSRGQPLTSEFTRWSNGVQKSSRSESLRWPRSVLAYSTTSPRGSDDVKGL